MMAKQAAVMFRRKVYVASPNHKDAIDLAFKGMSKLALARACDRISEGKEELIFGFAYDDGSEFVPSDSQGGRLRMYGFEPPYPHAKAKRSARP